VEFPPADTMNHLLPFLEKRSLAVTLALAVLVALILAPEVVSSQVTPYTDGNHYVQRAFALFGFLHTAQWAKFWHLLTTPRQALLPPQYPLFLLLPRAWAGLAAYGAIQLLVNFGVLALACWNLARVFARPAWAPALFVLCACENYSFDYPFFFFLDLTVTAFGALAFSCQAEAWLRPSPRAGLRAGAALGALFWIKPANALIFAAIFWTAESIWILRNLLRAKKRPDLRATLRPAAWLLAGFAPVFLLALALGAGQSIFALIQTNEVGGEWATHLEVGGLLRLLYFPLCFGYFYHVLVLALLAAAVVLFSRLFHHDHDVAGPTPAPFPGRALFALALACALFGEAFSFWVLVKTMRALLFLLPIAWLVVFYLAERLRVRGTGLLLFALAYAAVLVGQVTTDVFRSKPLAPDKYLLTDAWYAYLPLAWPHYAIGYGVVVHLGDMVSAELPNGGRVGLTTERVFLDGRSLALRLNGADLLDGRPPLYSCVRVLDADGRYSPNALTTANGLIIYVARNAQYSAFTWRENADLLAYVPGHWAAPETIRQVNNPQGRLLGYYVPLPRPLTPGQVLDGMKACGAPGVMPDDRLDEYIDGRHLTWRECLHTLHQWIRKRFG
jgi:hypothetical protein